MKKLITGILLLMLLVFNRTVSGQSKPDSVRYLNQTEQYCVVMLSSKSGNKVNVLVDYGQPTSSMSQYEQRMVKDEATNKEKTFESMADALNYMNSKGWIFVATYVVTYSTPVQCYLMKKHL